MADTPKKINLKYRLIRTDANEHSIVVRYFTDIVTEDSLATEFNPDGSIVRTEGGWPARTRTDYNLNIWKVPSPSQEEIEKIIQASAPADWLYLQEMILNPNVDTSLSNAVSLIDTVGSIEKELHPLIFIPESNTTVANAQSTNVGV